MFPEALARLVCRPALPKDTADVLALTSKIWEGQDYIAYVWPDWLADPSGLLAVAEFGSRVVGLGKLSDEGEGEWWLQGLRVDPAFQGQRVASHLHEYLLAHWEKLGGSVRLGTSSARVQVHHLCERTGFNRIMEYIFYAAQALPAGSHAFTPLGSGDIAEALNLAAQMGLSALTGDFIDLYWEWARLTSRRLNQLAIAGRVYWWHKEQRLGFAVVGEDPEEHPPIAFIQYLACQPDDLADLLPDCRRLASAIGYERIIWMAPTGAELQAGLEAAGFAREWEHSLYLFEKRK